MSARRARLRAKGLRPVQHWVPDLRDPRVRAELRREAALLPRHPDNVPIDAWIETSYDWAESNGVKVRQYHHCCARRVWPAMPACDRRHKNALSGPSVKSFTDAGPLPGYLGSFLPEEAAMTPTINDLIGPARERSEPTTQEPAFSVRIGLLVLCLAVLALAAWLQSP
jgi:hypothetical protein